jgi:aarF domain-containing kinase
MVATFVMRQLQVILLVLSFTSYSNSFVRNVATVSRSSAGLQNLKMVATASMSDVSAQMRDMREAMRADEKTALMMDALRGKNLNDDDRQGDGIDMQVVRMRAADDVNDVLPTVYNPARLEAYFSKRPGAVFTRVWQVAYASSSFLSGVLFDYITGSTDDVEVKRAAQLRNTIVSLGPFFIKLGQALSIRPDILSPRAMVELQQLCDKVPCFDSALAMRTIEEELGRPPSEIFSKMTAEPVAAASLGQVYKATLAETGEEVAVKVQRPFVLETVSLDLHLVRNIGLFLRKFPTIASRLDIVSILDEFANNFYQELDYNLECQNGIRVAEDMKRLPMVVIPKNYPTYTARRYVVQPRLIHFFLLFTDPIF